MAIGKQFIFTARLLVLESLITESTVWLLEAHSIAFFQDA